MGTHEHLDHVVCIEGSKSKTRLVKEWLTGQCRRNDVIIHAHESDGSGFDTTSADIPEDGAHHVEKKRRPNPALEVQEGKVECVQNGRLMAIKPFLFIS